MSLTQTIKLCVVRPVSGDWKSLGDRLTALSMPAHRVLNKTVSDLELAKRSGSDVHPRTMSYRLVRDMWNQEIAEAEERIEKHPINRLITEHKPKSSVLLGAAAVAYTRWSEYNKDRWKGKSVLPTFREQPVYVSSSGGATGVTSENGEAVLEVALCNGAKDRMIVSASGGSQHALLRRILSGEAKVGDVKIRKERHGPSKKRKWMASIAITLPDPPSTEGGRVMAMHRGMRSFLTVAISGGKREAYTQILETGEDVVKHKAGYTARRRSLGRQMRQLGKGAKGHGIKRRREALDSLCDAEARWVETKCREVAARALKMARKRGVSTIIVEDWGNPAKDGAPELGETVEYMVRTMPMAQLLECIKWRAKKDGVDIHVVRSDNNSRTCPKCSHRHEQPSLRRDRQGRLSIFVCDECKLERDVDVIFAWNMLVRAGEKLPLDDSIKRSKRQAGRLKKGSRKS